MHRVRIPGYLFLTCLFLEACHAGLPEADTLKTGAAQPEAYLPILKGKKVALVANHTTLIDGSHLADSLPAMGVKLVKIFSPEHGFRGEAGAGDVIENTVDRQTGLPVISLYGASKKPAAKDLQGVEAVVYDIQDVGVRFYTYISTMHYVMEACAEQYIPLIILDRPDPLGFYVDGPVLDTAYGSFVGLHPIPVVYGMTAGELALMINGEGWLKGNIKCSLTVIPCKGYRHDNFYSLPVNPSPNLNGMEAVYLYPSLCFFEGTIMSLGRGTEYPFRVVGHPEYPSKEFSFVPHGNPANKNPLFQDKTCYGRDFRMMTIEELRDMRQINIQWLIDGYRTMNRGDKFFTDYIDRLAGGGALRKQILEGLTEEQIRKSWEADLNAFRILRKKYLLYDDFTH